jgi:hypothetical protein
MRVLFHDNFFDVDWTADVLRVLLERSTSTYTLNRDHDHLDDFTTGGGVEISVASYSRKTLTTPAINTDNTQDQRELDADDVAFGNLEAGQTVKAIIGYVQVGGDDSTPATDKLLWYDDGTVDVVLAADASSGATLIWVRECEANIPNGTALDFGGGATCTLTSAASRGDDSISVTALGAAGSSKDRSASVVTDSILPAVLQNGPFTYQVHADGLIIAKQRGLDL